MPSMPPPPDPPFRNVRPAETTENLRQNWQDLGEGVAGDMIRSKRNSDAAEAERLARAKQTNQYPPKSRFQRDLEARGGWLGMFRDALRRALNMYR